MIELEVIPACQAYGIGIIPGVHWQVDCWAACCRGGKRDGALPKDAEAHRADARQTGGVENLCRELGESPANVALAWLLHQPAVTAPIIGPRTMQQLDETMRCLEIKLSEEVLKKLDEIFPGPGGPAPEAYAW
jgi:aryl-alcohol dehydrogenase-like predicted oxidoreductase